MGNMSKNPHSPKHMDTFKLSLIETLNNYVGLDSFKPPHLADKLGLPLTVVGWLVNRDLNRFTIKDLLELLLATGTLNIIRLKEPDDFSVKEIGQNIAYYRSQLNLSQSELGTMVSSRQPTVSGWESGRLKPGKTKLNKIAIALSVKPSLLMATRPVSKVTIDEVFDVETVLATAAFNALFKERKYAMAVTNC